MIPHLTRKIHSPQTWRDPAEAKRFLKNRQKKDSPSFLGQKRPKKKILKKTISFFLILLVLAWLGGTIMVAWASRDLPDPNKLIERSIAQSTKIYDRSGEHLLYEIFSDKKRTLIDLIDIPEYARWATILVEDKNFYQHKGVAWTSIFRAGVSNLLHLSSGRGGASTLTQQLIKNAILTNERTFTRKIKEAILAKQIEKKFSKEQILKMYFNEIPYGSANYGIEAASQSYFGKPAKEISLAEAATLAALPQAPTKYLNHQDKLKIRRDFILDLLAENGKISPEEAVDAKKETIKINRGTGALIAPHFVLYIKELVSEKYGEKMVEAGGLKIITTLNYDLQKIAEEEVKNGAEKNAKKYNAANAALTALDPKTGQILAMVGSKDYFDETIDGQVNVALRPRQPGSSFKPLVYAAGFEKGLTPDTKVYDVETIFKTETKDFIPHDYDGKERGLVTLRQALAGSLNIPAVKVLYLTGIDKILDLAEKMGYTTLSDRSRFGLALVLGGAEIRLLEHTHGFAVLANEGINFPYSAILEIKDAQNNTLEKWEQPPADQVLETQAARRVIDIMSDNNARAYIFGEKNPLTLPDRPVAAKTGTTNDWHDGWTMGFTPSLAVGVWVGNNDNKAMVKGADGVFTAGPIWHNFMARALKDKPVEGFTLPDSYPAETKPILLGQGLGEITLAVNRLNNKLASERTPSHLIEYRTYRQPHSILNYLNKDDLLGPPPADPSHDPQFASWEEAVKIWTAKQGITSDTPPTENDDGSSSGLIPPPFTIVSPAKNQTINIRDLNVVVQSAKEQEIKKMEFFLDEELMETKTTGPFNIILHLFDAPRGFHNLKIRAWSSTLAYGEADVDFNLTAPDEPPNISWLHPLDQEMVIANHFPMAIKIKLHQLEKIKELKILLSQKDSGQPKIIFSLTEPTEKIIVVPWNKAPATGIYNLSSNITTLDGKNYEGAGIEVEVK